MKLAIKLLRDDARMPTYAHAVDAGMDLYAAEACVINSRERAQVPTGIALAVPDGYVGLIWDKSGISQKGGLKTLGGVVDAGYRGEVMVGIVNLGDGAYHVEKGAKIAQMLIQKVEHPELMRVEKLDDTERGTGGFGSTGN